jgi:hypothetical protein
VKALVCAWCSAVLRDGTAPATTGICGGCRERQLLRLAARRATSDAPGPGPFRALWLVLSTYALGGLVSAMFVAAWWMRG